MASRNSTCFLARRRALAFIASSLVALAAPIPARAADEIHWTIVGQTAVAFDWRGRETTIEFGTSPGVYTRSVTATAPSPMPNSSAGPFQEARITGLVENTLYYYRIGTGTESTFRTPPPRGGSGFWIAAEADIGTSTSYATVLPNQQGIAEDSPNLSGDDRPRFVLVAGDLTYGDDHGRAHVDQHFNDVMVWSRFAAYMPAWGNHEWGSAEDDLQNYEGRFDLPNTQTSPGAPSSGGPGDDWYWFDYGNARFISFPEPYSGAWSDWKTKAGAIMAAAQADAAITFIVTYGHRPAYSSGSDHGGEPSIATPMKDLHALYSKYVMNIQGHTHHYERTDPAQSDGIVHIITGGGGSSLGGLASSAPSWSVYRMEHVHHLKLYFAADRILGYCMCGPAGAGNADTCSEGSVVDAWVVMTPGAADQMAPAPPGNLRLRP